MEIFPAIDIINGNAVRLTKGEYDSKEIYAADPVTVLDDFITLGARKLHVVDLDGAFEGKLRNFDTVKRLCERKNVEIQVGGGIRDVERIEQYLSLGVKRVILGTAVVRDYDFLKASLTAFGDAIAVGVDAKDGFVAIDGWKTVTRIQAFDFCRSCRDIGVKTVVYTDISTDGAMQGTNLAAFSRLKSLDGLNIVASGGVTYIEELKELKKIGVYGVILGKALYKGLLSLSDALAVADGE